MKTPREIAFEAVNSIEAARNASDRTAALILTVALRAIEADRAQLRDKLLDYDEWERLASDDEPAVRMTKIQEALA